MQLISPFLTIERFYLTTETFKRHAYSQTLIVLLCSKNVIRIGLHVVFRYFSFLIYVFPWNQCVHWEINHIDEPRFIAAYC